jgi:hypothetical protein
MAALGCGNRADVRRAGGDAVGSDLLWQQNKDGSLLCCDRLLWDRVRPKEKP